MRRIRRFFTALAAPALILGLAACSGAESPGISGDPPRAEAGHEETESSDDGGQEDLEQRDEDTDADVSDGGADDPAGSGSPEDDSTRAATEIRGLWVDDTWTISERDDDPCAFSLMVSPFSQLETVFLCGANADSARACALEDAETALCITDPEQRTAQRFPSPTLAELTEPPAREQEPIPLTATLEDGTFCTSVTHDGGQHWNGMNSWYLCEDGSELLAEEEIDSTFDQGETWTVQRSWNGGAPETTDVEAVEFADPSA